MSRLLIGATVLGTAYFGSTAAVRDDAPDAGSMPWDHEIQDPSGTAEYGMSDGSQSGRDDWYRIDARIIGDDVNHDFRQEYYDLEVTDGIGDAEYPIEEE